MLAKFQLVMVKACPYHQKEQKKQWYQSVSSSRIWDRHMTFTRFEKGDFPIALFFDFTLIEKIFPISKKGLPLLPYFFCRNHFYKQHFWINFLAFSLLPFEEFFWNVHYVELIKTTRQLVFKILEQLQNYKLY